MTEETKDLVALKPCPFCGSPHPQWVGSPDGDYVECGSCLATMPPHDPDVPDEVARWNTRLTADRERSVGEWQPIETAPKDGTPFMVWAPGYEWPEVIRWYPYDAETAEEVGEPGYWHYAEQSMADQFDWEHEVTRWMPLPAAPISAATSGKEGDALSDHLFGQGESK